MDQLATQDSFLKPLFDKISGYIGNLPSVIVGLLIGILIVRLLTYLARWILKLAHMEPGLRQVLSSIIELILWFLLIIAFLQNIGFANVILFFTSSVAALAIVMAAGGSTLISDIFAGIFIAQDKDFKVGDRVTAGPDKTTGVIEKIDARRTRIRDDEGILHILPNTLVERNEWTIEKRIANRSAMRRVKKTADKIKATVIESVKSKNSAK